MKVIRTLMRTKKLSSRMPCKTNIVNYASTRFFARESA